jgi:F-type H+-transporting ATPase subunit a
MIGLQAAENAPGTHPAIQVCGSSFCNLDIDSLISTGIAIAVTLAIAFLIRYRLTHGVPGRLQVMMESLLLYARQQVAEIVHLETARFVIPLATTLAVYILIANWVDFFPITLIPYVIPANSDLNQTAAMAILVIILVEWYSISQLRLRGFLRRFTKPFDMKLWARILFVPLNIIEEVAKPITLSLRLFGNIFAGVVMVFLIPIVVPALVTGFLGFILPSAVTGPLGTVLSIVANAVWKLFDVGLIGAIQAFIFFLLTIIYFGMAREGLEEEAHAVASH